MVTKKDITQLQANKADRIKIEKGLPAKHEGRNGNFSVRLTRQGLVLFAKFNDKWYRIGKLEDIHRDRGKYIGTPESKDFKDIGADSIHPLHSALDIKLDGTKIIRYDGTDTKIIQNNVGGSPIFQMGSSDTECLQIKANYVSGGKGIDFADFISKTASIEANKAAMRFFVDEAQILLLDDGGADIIGGITTTSDAYINGGGLRVKKTSGAAAIVLAADNSASAGDDWTITSNADHTLSIGNDIASAGTPYTHINITPHATILNASTDVKTNLSIPETAKFHLSGPGGTDYITMTDDSSHAGQIEIATGGDVVMFFNENGVHGNIATIQGAACFKNAGGTAHIYEPTYGDVVYTADSGNNTDIDFRQCNKARIELTASATVGIMGFLP